MFPYHLSDGQTVYAVNLGKDHVGISTIGFTSTTGIGTQLNAAEFVNFDSSFPLIGAALSFLLLIQKLLELLKDTVHLSVLQ